MAHVTMERHPGFPTEKDDTDFNPAYSREGLTSETVT